MTQSTTQVSAPQVKEVRRSSQVPAEKDSTYAAVTSQGDIALICKRVDSYLAKREFGSEEEYVTAVNKMRALFTSKGKLEELKNTTDFANDPRYSPGYSAPRSR